MKKRARLIATLPSLLAALGVTGCVATTPHWDAHFGEAATILAVEQTRDAGATAANADRPVDGIEGRSARETMDRYYKSFSEPPKPYSVFTIGVGTAAPGGGAR